MWRPYFYNKLSMKIRYIFAILLIAALMVACEKPANDPTPDKPQQEEPSNGENEGNENESNENEGNENEGNEDNSWIDNPTPMPEATYVLNERLTVSSLVSIADGLRNDYMTLYQESTGYAVYFDIYTADSNTVLPTGRYILSNEQVNTVYYEWSYFTPYTNSDLYRFTEGWLEVIADAEHSSGYPYHKIRGYFLMESDDSVSIEWEGTITNK